MVGSKKGVIKTIEAVFSIIIILLFIYFIAPEKEATTDATPQILSDAQNYLLDEITFEDSYRGCIKNNAEGMCKNMGGCMRTVAALIDDNTPPGYKNACELCDTSISCVNNGIPLDKSVYTDSVFVSGQQSKVLRIYFWREI